jgi:hypothetical protein
MRILALAAAVLLVDGTKVQMDWGAALRTDATAMHDAIALNHPGPVNPADPGFSARNDAELERALARARAAKTFADYFYAMQQYAASFNDGHLSYGVWRSTPDVVQRWPGFLTRYDASGHQTVVVSEPWSGVPVGAQLLSCDGRSADKVARDRLGSRVGRWGLASQRELFGAMTFLDVGDPYVGIIQRCRFDEGGNILDVSLKWEAPKRDLHRYLIPAPINRDVTRRVLPDGTQWFHIPSFNGDPDSTVGKQLREIVAYIRDHAHQVRTAPAVVFDLRGNGGGSSDWSYQIADQLWGRGALARHPEPPMTISWRASQDNLAAIKTSLAARSKNGNLSADASAWYKETIAGLGKALSAGDPLWVIKPVAAGPAPRAKAAPSYRIKGPVYVLTDSACMSACLDAVDLWTRLGAITVGRETSADTLYMEVRQVPLPAGLGAFSLPMKVYSGRSRGSNQPVLPRHRFSGDMADTRALENWIAMLPEPKRHR